MQRRIHTRIVDYDCGILRFQVRALLRKIYNNILGVFHSEVTILISLRFFFHKFERADLSLTIIISFFFFFIMYFCN